MKIAIGNDHTAIELKRVIVPFLSAKGITVIDAGTNSTDSFPYAVSGYRVARLVADGIVQKCSRFLLETWSINAYLADSVCEKSGTNCAAYVPFRPEG